MPKVFSQHQNYPNLFNQITTLHYDIPDDANANIIIYGMMGRHVRTLVNNWQTAGYKSLQWDASNDAGLPVSGCIYLYMIQAGEFM